MPLSKGVSAGTQASTADSKALSVLTVLTVGQTGMRATGATGVSGRNWMELVIRKTANGYIAETGNETYVFQEMGGVFVDMDAHSTTLLGFINNFFEGAK
jgi:hypothetical protein